MPSPSLRAHALAFAFDARPSLFSEVSFHLAAGWTGLVGANGSGKSTLLRLLTGELEPTAGSLVREPRVQRLHLCPQEVGTPGPEVEALAESSSGAARKLMGLLKLEPWRLDAWETLSPGERKRWQLGAALALEPDVLLVDEPTNHLDGPGRELLLGALRRFRGVGVVVSHDRTLLDSLTRQTLRVHGGGVRAWSGPWSEARAAWEAEAAAQREARTSAVERAAKTRAQVDSMRRAHEGASRQVSTGARMRSKYDSDARGLLARYAVETAQKSLASRLSSARRELAEAEGAIPEFEVDKTLGRSVFVDFAPAPKPHLIQLELPELLAGPERLTGALSLTVGREDRIHLSGANGAGKSTLLAALLAHARIPGERILWLAQELEAREIAADLAEVRALPPELRGRTLSLVAALGVDPDRLLATPHPSPGESRKLRLALGLARHAWLLVLDEPTNHLDLPTVERLEEALQAYPGALMLVTHDPHLARACTRTRWHLEGGTLTVSSVESPP